MGVRTADLQGRLVVLEAVEVVGHGVHERQVGVGQRGVGALDGEEDPAGEDVLREGLFEEVVAANAGAAGGQEANVVVLDAVSGRGGDEGDGGPRSSQAAQISQGYWVENRPRVLNMLDVSPKAALIAQATRTACHLHRRGDGGGYRERGENAEGRRGSGKAGKGGRF